MAKRKKTVSKKLRQIIIDSEESDYGIAKDSGVDQAVITRFRNDSDKEIRSKTLDRLCEYFGVTLTDLKK